MSRWFRHYAGMMSDPKFGGIARRCCCNVAATTRADVLFVWCCILESAAEKNSSTYTFDADSIAELMAVDTDFVQAIHDEMERSGLLSDGKISQWDQRQFVSDSSTERSRRHRAAKRDGNATLQQQGATPPETKTETETEIKKSTTVPVGTVPRKPHDFSPEFEAAWADYPKRNGDNPKRRAYQAWRARLGEKDPAITPEVMHNGVRRYAAWCKATGKLGTETVKQAATFFGPDKPFLNTWDSPKQQTPVGDYPRTDDGWMRKGKELGIHARAGEQMSAYIGRIRSAMERGKA